jgi:hypothetical protein
LLVCTLAAEGAIGSSQPEEKSPLAPNYRHKLGPFAVAAEGLHWSARCFALLTLNKCCPAEFPDGAPVAFALAALLFFGAPVICISCPTWELRSRVLPVSLYTVPVCESVNVKALPDWFKQPLMVCCWAEEVAD